MLYNTKSRIAVQKIADDEATREEESVAERVADYARPWSLPWNR